MKTNDILKDNRELLKRYLSPSLLRALSDLLNSQLDDISKDNILKLVLTDSSLDQNLLADFIHHFFLNESFNRQEDFCQLIYSMKNRKLDISFVDACITLGKVVDHMDVESVIEWAKTLVNLPNGWYSNCGLVNALLNDERILKDIDRFDIVIDVLSKKKATYDRLNGEGATPYLVEVLANDAFDFPKRNDAMFRKMVEFAIDNVCWHFVYFLLKQGIETEKIWIAVDYYSSLRDQYIYDYDFIPLDYLDCKFKHIPLYYLPVQFSDLETSVYAEKLRTVKDSPNPLSHVIVEESNISADRKQFAIELIDGVHIGVPISPFGKSKIDYLNHLAIVATTPLAQSLTMDQYKELLQYMKNCILKNRILEKEEKVKHTCRYLDDSSRRIPDLLATLFVKAPFMAQNQEQLQYLIELIRNSSEENYYVVKEVVEIVTNMNAMYYSNEEFKELVAVMQEIHDRGYVDGIKKDQEKYFILQYLFSQENVPFMSKRYLFEFARTKTEEEIVEQTKVFRRDGFVNANIAMICDGSSYSLETPPVLEKKIQK